MNKLILEEFPTHIEISKNKYKANRWMKINSQSIYNGQLARFARAIAIGNIHDWIKSKLIRLKLPDLKFPVQLQLDIFTVINHGSISRRKGIIICKDPKKGYKPNWDEDNLSYIWNKCIKDVLTELKVWPDDSVEYCIGTNSKVHFVDSLSERRIELNFK